MNAYIVCFLLIVFYLIDIFHFPGSYLAPEYFMYGKVNDKIDVYAFGVVLLELLSGRKPISNDNPKGQESLVMWVCIFSSYIFSPLQAPLVLV